MDVDSDDPGIFLVGIVPVRHPDPNPVPDQVPVTPYPSAELEEFDFFVIEIEK